MVRAPDEIVGMIFNGWKVLRMEREGKLIYFICQCTKCKMKKSYADPRKLHSKSKCSNLHKS